MILTTNIIYISYKHELNRLLFITET